MKKIATYSAITALSIVVLLLFQLIGMSLGLFDSDYEVNQYADSEPAALVEVASSEDGGFAIVGRTAVPAAEDACYYLKRKCLVTPTLTDEALSASVLVWSDTTISLANDLPRLLQFAHDGHTLIFAQIPSLSLILQSADLRTLLGIENVLSYSTHTNGTWLYDDFLLGGEKIYESLKPNAPWFSLSAGYSVYMSAFVDKVDTPEPETLPLLWRTRSQNGFVFVCNNRYLFRAENVGMVYAMLSKTTEYTLYPVINAQTMTVQNFPYLSNENRETMHSWYHQTSDKLFFNALLPNVTAVFSNMGYPLTCLFTGSFDGLTDDSAIDWTQLSLYIRLIVGRSGEMGVSGYEHSGALAVDKLTRDLGKLEELARAYTLTVFAPNGMSAAEYDPLLTDGALLENIRTLVQAMTSGGDVQRYAYYNDRVIQMPVTTNGFDLDDEGDLALHSMETALLAGNISVDMQQVLYPQSTNDDWALLSKTWSDNLTTAIYPFDDLDKLCLSDADRRTRTYLNLDYTVTKDADRTLRIHIENFTDTVYFVLRRADIAVGFGRNVTVTQLEDDAYLLAVTAADASLKLGREHHMLYY